MDLPLAAFPSWFLKITCDRCDKDRMRCRYRCNVVAASLP
jgi:hypothetical protein